MSKYLAIFKKRRFWQILGLAVLGAVIWLIGPLIPIGERMPLESPWVRLGLILVLIGIWAATLLWSRWRAARAAREIGAGLAGARDPGSERLDEDLRAMQERFARAIELLKQTRKGKRDFSERYLYEIPWYVIIGPPGCGKTTLLGNSELEFPLKGQLGRDKIKIEGVGGTRNCDWFFAEQAILLDTAGRFATQDSQREADAGAWLGFLDLLKRYRPRQPINGVLVAVSLDDLLRQSEREREIQAEAIRARIEELRARLNVRFPIYLLVTKCDLAAGFSEFFEDLGKGKRAQVWGATFALADAEGNERDFGALALSEIDALLERLNARMLQRVEDGRTLSRRARIFGFPRQMAAVRGALGDFVRQAFNPSRYRSPDHPPLLRGLYFTSATQVGAPIDRLIKDLEADYGLHRGTANGDAQGGAGEEKGYSYFINTLFREIVFPESNLVGSDPRAERRRRWLRRGAYAGVALATLGAVLGWIWSYTDNQAAIADVRHAATRYQESIVKLPLGTEDFAALAEALDRLGAAAERFAQSSPPTMGLGLYQGERVRPSAQDAYRRVLASRLLPSLGERLRKRLREPASPQETAARLKAYLMLTEPARREPEALAQVMAADWAGLYPHDEGLRQRLAGHLEALLADAFDPLAADLGLVQEVRNRLARQPLWEILYAQIKTEAATNRSNDCTLADLIGPKGDLVFESSLGDPSELAVAGLFTLEGLRGVFRPQSRRLIDQARQDAWVYGIPEDQEDAHVRKLAEALAGRYADEYQEAWRRALDSLRIRSTGNLDGPLMVASTAAASPSPLRQVIERVVKETQPAAATEQLLAAGGKSAEAAGSAVEVAAAMSGKVQVLTQRVKKLHRATKQAGLKIDLLNGAETSALKRIDDHFAKLRALAAKRQDRPSQLDALIEEIGTFAESLRDFQQSDNPDGNALVRIQEGRGPAQALLTRAQTLPSPVGGWVFGIARGGSATVGTLALDELNKLWQDQIYADCRSTIEGRYPFARAAANEAKLADFARFFGPDQKLDGFFKKYLAKLVDTAATPWRWRAVDGKVFGGSPESLAQLERAERIRRAFFPAGGSLPGIEFSITPTTLDAGSQKFVLNIDGQQIEYSHGREQPTKVRWPAPDGAGYARLEFLALEGRNASLGGAPGDWAWFRLLERAQIKRPRGEDAVIAAFARDGHSMSIEIRANSVFNPLQLPDLGQFKCLPNL